MKTIIADLFLVLGPDGQTPIVKLRQRTPRQRVPKRVGLHRLRAIGRRRMHGVRRKAGT